MKKVLSSCLVLTFLASAAAPSALRAQQQQTTDARQEAQAAPAKLTNKEVVDMLKAGLSAEVVAAKIKSSGTDFDTSPAALLELKAAGVPDAVMLAMVRPAAEGSAVPAGGAAPAADSAATAAAVDVKVPDGTEIEIELRNNVSAQELNVGDTVDFAVVRAVIVDGVTVVEKGASARARVTLAKRAGHWGRAGKLEWAMQDVRGADGTRIPARFTKRVIGDSKGGTVALGAVATSVLFFPVAPLWGLKKGKPAVIAAGNRYSAFVHGDASVRGFPAAPAAQ